MMCIAHVEAAADRRLSPPVPPTWSAPAEFPHSTRAAHEDRPRRIDRNVEVDDRELGRRRLGGRSRPTHIEQATSRRQRIGW